jgi:hypothetical protein
MVYMGVKLGLFLRMKNIDWEQSAEEKIINGRPCHKCEGNIKNGEMVCEEGD